MNNEDAFIKALVADTVIETNLLSEFVARSNRTKWKLQRLPNPFHPSVFEDTVYITVVSVYFKHFDLFLEPNTQFTIIEHRRGSDNIIVELYAPRTE